MTDLPLDEMEAALDAATPGEWGYSRVRYRRDAMDWLNIVARERETLIATALAPEFHNEANAHAITLLHNNARALIAAARQALKGTADD